MRNSFRHLALPRAIAARGRDIDEHAAQIGFVTTKIKLTRGSIKNTMTVKPSNGFASPAETMGRGSRKAWFVSQKATSTPTRSCTGFNRDESQGKLKVVIEQSSLKSNQGDTAHMLHPKDSRPSDAVAAVEYKEVRFGSNASDERKAG